MKKESVVVSIRIPKKLFSMLKKKHSNVSAYIRTLIEAEEQRRNENVFAKLHAVNARKGPERGPSIGELIREDRDVLH